MPELPEVEIIRRGLSRHILSETIEDVDIRLPRQIHFPSAPEFRAQIRGCTIKEVQRRFNMACIELALLRYEDVPSRKCSAGASISFLRLRTA